MNDMDLLGILLDIGVAMIGSGAETHRVEDSLYRLAASYGFSRCNIWVVPSNIQATVTSPKGVCLTQIRHIRRTGVDFDRLDRLNSLSRYACTEVPAAEELAARLREIDLAAPQAAWKSYLAGMLAGTGFGVFFGCDPMDACAAAAASALITFLSRRLSGRESNALILNFIISVAAECFILGAVRLGFGHHAGAVTVGVIMLLISALGTTNGVRDLVHLDTLSGVMNITASLTGAIGIAMGIALPLMLFGGQGAHEVMRASPDAPVGLLAAMAGSAGFAVWFNVRGKKIACCALGALLTWGVYLAAERWVPGNFGRILTAAVFCGFYAQAMARLNKAPATIFMTVSVFPLIPGAALYYMMYGIVTQDAAFARAKGIELLLGCFGIVFGFMVVEVASRYIWRQKSGLAGS